MFVIAPGWEDVLRAAGLDSFDRLWNLDTDWVEAPNERRRGWSGVVRRELATAEGSTTLFIKRQTGQNRRTPRHPFRGRPTYFLEYDFLRRHGARFPQLVGYACYGEVRDDDRDRAVLATLGLSGFRDLDASATCESREQLQAVLTQAARAVVPLHRRHLQHGALYACHIFTHQATRECRLIDLERARFRTRARAAAEADLSQFVRRTPWLDDELLDTFLAPWEEHFPGLRKHLPAPDERTPA